MLALGAPDPALGLPAGTSLQPILFVRNTLAKTVTAHLRFNWRSTTDTGKSAPMDLILKANETKVLDVGALQDGKTLPRDANWASVILSAPVLPDELLAVAASYDQTGRYGAQTPFSDQLAPHWEGGKWEVDSTHNSLSTIINGSDKPVVAELTIFYNQGSAQYQIQRQLAPEEQMFVDFGKLIHDQIPDKNGQTLPHDLTFGAYRVRDLTDSTTASLYEGKVVVDKTFGHVSYGCMICCGPDTPFMMYDPLGVSVGGFTKQEVQAMDSCTEHVFTITGDFSTWWTGNTAIATASGSSIGGVAPGTTTNNAQSIMMYFGPKEDSGGGPCPQDQQDASGSTNVAPVITSIDPDMIMIGSNNVQLTIKGQGFGTVNAPTVSLPPGVTNVNNGGSSDTAIVITVNVTFNATIGINTLNVINNDNGLGSNESNFTIDGPSQLVLEGDVIGFCTGCHTTVSRLTTYQVLNFSGAVPNGIQICEAPNWSTNTCGNGQPFSDACGINPVPLPGNGQFQDQWSLQADGLPSGCGFQGTDIWNWSASAITFKELGMLTGYVHSNSIEINLSIMPPQANQIPNGTLIPH